MAIRDRFRRALHKSDSSDSIAHSEAPSSPSTRRSSSSETPPVTLIKTSSSSSSTSSRFVKSFKFGSRDKNKDAVEPGPSGKTCTSKSKARPHRTKPVYTHPSQRPLTEQNLRHQEMFSHFTMTFGASNPAQIDDYGGVSPCCTRPCTRDG